MHGDIKPIEKYERGGWPSIQRPDNKPPPGWDRSLLVGVNRIYNHSLSPDGANLVYFCNHGHDADLYSVSSGGGWPNRLTVRRPAVQYWWEETPAWSPDSQWIAYCQAGMVWVLSSQGGLPVCISNYTDGASSPVWMPDNRSLIVRITRDDSTHLFLADRFGNWPIQLTGTGAIEKGEGDDADARPSPDGRSVAFIHYPRGDLNRGELRLLDLASRKERCLVGEPGLKVWEPRWSPDGSSIAFISQKSGFNEIWMVSLADASLRQVTNAGFDLGQLAWSPDGSWLLAVANRGGMMDLVQVDPVGGSGAGDSSAWESGAWESVADFYSFPGVISHPAIARDGSFVTFEAMSPTLPPDIYRINLNGRKPGELFQLTFSNLPALARLPLVNPGVVSYPSFDGLEIHGLLYRPLKPNGAAIVHPHGGPREQHLFEWEPLIQYLVAKGYTYLALNYRGGTGYGLAFEHANDFKWGIGDTQDCLSAAKYLAGLPGVDADRIGIQGSSYGGYLVACCLSRDPETWFACGASICGDADLFNSWALCERTTRFYTEMQIGHPARNRQVYQAGSPVFEVENVKKPVLILHGLDDDVVPPESSEEWVEALRKAGKTYEYKTYAGESHGLLGLENRLDSYERIERFFDWYLLPDR